jgi:hypothetical protein
MMGKPQPDKESIAALGREVTALVQNYVRPILCSDPPLSSNNPVIKGGTVTFVKTAKRTFGITNHHVIKGLRKIQEQNSHFQCQLDSLPFNIDQRLIAQNERLDLATVDISDSEIQRIGALAYTPSTWPPSDPPRVGELAVIVGYPGRFRYPDSSEQICVPHIGLNLPITSISQTDITFHFERQYWITDVGTVDPSRLDDFGGMSGSGVFVMRLAPVLVGVVYEFGSNFDLLKCSRTDFVTEEGIIEVQLL